MILRRDKDGQSYTQLQCVMQRIEGLSHVERYIASMDLSFGGSCIVKIDRRVTINGQLICSRLDRASGQSQSSQSKGEGGEESHSDESKKI